MLTLVNILILFFIFLILYQILLANNIIEGLENQYQPYDTNNPNNALILAQQNAGNISYLKERLDSVQGLDKQVQDISGNVTTLQSQVTQMVQQQQEYANQMTGGSPPQITGAVDDGTTNTSTTTDTTITPTTTTSTTMTS
jgi:predicted PurR-regulated permease PerM